MQNNLDQLLHEIYDAYKEKVEEATSIWKSEYSCSISDDENRDIEDKEDLLYFEGLLREIKKLCNWKSERKGE